MINLIKNTTLITASITLLAVSAQAQSPAASTPASKNQNGLSLGINVIGQKSAYDQDDKLTVLPSMFYDNGQVYARGSQFGGYIIDDSTNEFSGYLQPAGSTFDPNDTDGALRQLDKRKPSIMAGVSYLRTTPIGGFRGQLATDITGRSEGTIAKLTYLAKLTPGKWTIYPSAGLEWTNSDYNEYYYGISSKESAKSGISTYSPDSSISPYISVNGMYAINDDWDLFLGQSINYLADEQYDSPMVDDRVDYRTTVGMLYKF